MKLNVRKVLAILATLATLCAVLPLGSLFSAVAEGDVVFNATFDGGETDGFSSSSDISVADGALQFNVTKDWGNIYTGLNVEANTDYEVSFRAKSQLGKNFWVKFNDNWGPDVAQADVSISKEWKDYTVTLNSGACTSVILLVQYAGYAAEGEIVWLDNITVTKVGGGSEPEQPDVPADGNLIVNGDFETGDNSGWEIWQSTSISADAAKDGAYGAHLVGNGSWGGMLNQTVAVEAGKQYKLSFWINVNACGVNVQVKNGAGDSIEGAGGWFDANKTDKQVEWTFTATDSSVFINFCGSGSAPEDVYVDNFSLVAVDGGDIPDVPEDDALIKNGGFETAELHSNITPGGVAGAWYNVWGSCDVEFVEGNESTYAIKIVAGGWSQVRQDMIPVEANTDYVLTVDAKYAENFGVVIKKGDDSGDVTSMMLESSSQWSTNTLEFNTGDLTSICVLLIGWEGGGDAIIDNVVLAKKGEEPDQPDEPDQPTDSAFVNGGFENGSEGWELGSAASITDEDAHTGSYSLKLENPGLWAAAAVQNVAVKPNTEYVVKMWVKRIEKTQPFNLFMMDAADNRNLEVVSGQNWFNTNDSEWTEKTIVINTGAATEIIIKWSSETSNAGILLVDDMTIAEKDAPPAPSAGLVINGDFETGDTTGWEKWQDTVVSEDAAHSGKYGVNLIGNGGWGGLLNQTFEVENGETYIITLWACVNASGANLQVKGADKVEEESDNTYLDAKELTGWTQRTFTFVANSNEMTLNFCGGGTNKAEDIYIDDIVVVKKGEIPPVEDTYPIKNAGFESGELHSNVTPGGVTGVWYNVWGSCVVGFENPGHDKSQYALNFEGPGAWQQVRQDGIPVEPNTDYTLIAYLKNPLNINLVVKTADDSANIADYGVTNDMSNSWVRQEVSFNSGDQTAVCVLIISNADGNGTALVDNVQIYKKGEEPAEPEPDAPATEGPMSLDSYGTSINRPATEDANLIQNGSFEDAEGGQWQSVISDTLYVVDDETAPEGNKSLYFNTSGVTENNKVIFYLDVEPNTDYVFSAWVKGAYISADNRFNATFGVTDWKDNFCVYQDAKFSNKNRQIVPTAWDNEWHLRAVQFNSGVNTKIGIGFAGAESQMWIDGMALYTVDNGIKYGHPRQVCYIIPSPLYENEGACADEHNLIADATMSGSAAQEFWSSAEGFQNGFISFPENEYEYGTSLKYTGNDDSCYIHAIKWLEVKPNTTYTFSMDARVVKTGGGGLVLLDGKKRDCDAFVMVDFDQYGYGVDWFNIVVEFNSGEFDRIGIAIVDGGGEALVDNMRLFESQYRIAGGVEDDYVDPPYDFGDPEDPEGPVDPDNPDSPVTGVSVLGAALVVALVPSSALVAFKVRRKKEDEE